jgi:hypothetical protein
VLWPTHNWQKKRRGKMAFERLQSLGQEKFQRIVNELMRATPAVMVARLIHQEWGDVHDVAENTLAKQLKRLHTAITNGAFGGDLAEQPDDTRVSESNCFTHLR